MKNTKKLLALLLALAMVFALAACGGQTAAPAGNDEPAPAGTDEPAPAEVNDTLVVGYDPFNSKFSPFFSETAYDQDVYAMTQIGLVTLDRTAGVIMNAIEGETVPYNGTDYTYYGPADIVVTQNDDGSVFYDFKLREDITFSDGEPLTIDDVIFSMYVLCDPTYDGSSSLFSLPILGIDEYRSGMDSLANLIIAAGRGEGYVENEYFTEEEYNTFWSGADEAVLALAQDICDCIVNDYGMAEEGDVITAAGLWGFAPAENTIESFAEALWEAYGDDVLTMIGTEQANLGLDDLFPAAADFTGKGIQTGESASKIEGIQKTGDYSLRVVLTAVDATAILQLGVAIAPMHYYGDASLYDYDNDSFGFVKGDLSIVRSKTTQPLGAGAYKFVKFENGVVYFEANESYYLGAPKIPFVNFVETTTEDDKLNGVVTGTIDIANPSFSKDFAGEISTINSNGEITGDIITTSLVDNLGYGYIAMSANVINVGGEPGSDASKNLRRALGTIFAVYRDVANDSYYGEAASTINYPISNTSWAAPRPSDDDYQVAFSTDVEGNPIYTSSMSAEERYEAARQAALGFFEAAGFTVEDGKVVAAPEGASLTYDAMIPAGGDGDHPAFMLLNEAAASLEQLGITLVVKDLANSSELWTSIQAETIGIWTAAWGASSDPDMYQVYFSGDETHKPGGSAYMYDIVDPELNQLILDARANLDQTYRKAVYKACLDIVIDWACEIPNYQRQNCIIFSTERVNIATVTPDITPFYGWMSEIQNLELN